MKDKSNTIPAMNSLILEMVTKGRTPSSIARQIVSQNEYFQIVQQLSNSEMGEWEDKVQEARAQLIVKELGRIDSLEIAAWEGYIASFAPTVTETANFTRSPKDAVEETNPFELLPSVNSSLRNKTIIKYKPSSGDPKFLKAIHDAQVERRTLLGLYPAKRSVERQERIVLKGYMHVSPDDWDDEKESTIVQAQ